MERKNTRTLVGVAALSAAAALTVLGLVMTGNASFAKSYTTEQLVQQNITFKPLDALTEEEGRSPCLVKYAGQRLTTGAQAECYANDFIGLHVKSLAGGKTYAELGGPERGLQAKVEAAQKANDPALADLQKQHASVKGQRDKLFQGETARGLLLTSFGFSVLGAKAEQAATVSYIVAGLVALVSVGSLLLGRRKPTGDAVTPPTNVETVTRSKQHATV